MKNNLPVIHIRHGRLLDPVFTAWVKSHEKWKDIEVPSKEEVLEQIQKYKEAWEPREKTILNAMTEVTGMEFLSSLITVHVVSLNPQPFSSPIVVKSRYEPEEFVEILTHELIHKLQSEEQIQDKRKGIEHRDVREFWRSHYPDENIRVHNHIYVYAILEYIYRDFLKEPERFEQDKDQLLRQMPQTDHRRAREIVKERGYKRVIEEVNEFRNN